MHQDQGILPQEWLLEEQEAILAAAAAAAASAVASATVAATAAAAAANTRTEDQDQSNTISNSNNINNGNNDNNNNDNGNNNNNNDDNDGGPSVYIGDYNILGQRHGSHGELIWDNGDRYVGTFKNGMRSGQGTFFFRDGKYDTIRYDTIP